jgi:hypothetical protein
MHYINYTNRLQERGLHAVYIKELTGVRIEPRKNLQYKRMTKKQLKLCLNTVKHDKYGLLRVLDMFPNHNPNEIYKHIRPYLQPFNANQVFKELILALIRDGVTISAINVLIRPLTDALPSYAMLAHISRSVGLKLPKLQFNQKQAMLIMIIKYIQYKSISKDHKGYFLLRKLFPEVESRVIASAIVKSIDYIVKSCTICNLEFIAAKNTLFCNKCRRAV